MHRFYFLIIILQVICLVHAYKNKAQYYWYWGIIFFPIIGCIAYTYIYLANMRNVDKVAEGVKQVVNPSYKVNKLEKEMTYSGTVNNKLALALEYSNNGDTSRAIGLYEECLDQTFDDDSDIIRKLIRNYYLQKDYNKVIEYASKIKDDKLFAKSEEKTAYAWALFFKNDRLMAEEIFKEMDIRFINYSQRLEYAKFLNELERKEEAINLLEELLDEIESMDHQERRFKKQDYKRINQYFKELARKL